MQRWIHRFDADHADGWDVVIDRRGTLHGTGLAMGRADLGGGPVDGNIPTLWVEVPP